MNANIRISALPVLSVVINVKAISNIVWNSFPGSVVHGLSIPSQGIACVVKHRDCKKCFLTSSCAYGMIYESPVPPDSKRMRLYPQRPTQ
jgi:hypothetical protein